MTSIFFEKSRLTPELTTAIVTPRPIAWVSSCNSQGEHNLAPYSLFNLISVAPPMITLAALSLREDGQPKDTIRNIEETHQFVVNLADSSLKEQLNITAKNLPYGVSEFDLAQVTPSTSRLVIPPRVDEAPISLECQYYTTIKLPSTNPKQEFTRMILAYIVGAHINENLLENNKLCPQKISSLVKLGYDYYAQVSSNSILK